MVDQQLLQSLCRLIRYDVLASTTAAASGHPSSCLSAVELMTSLFFTGFYHFDPHTPNSPNNDRIIFSKGHTAPLLYALYHAAGLISLDELLTLRTFNSRLEGHPTPRFPYAEVATGSLGQGLSIGAGMALGMKLRIKRIPKVYVLLGDGEMTEGAVWEAMEMASCYNLNNLIGILDLNRFELAGSTIHQWDIETFEKRIQAFGWNTIAVKDGHDLQQVEKAYVKLLNLTNSTNKPSMLIAKTKKGKGCSIMEDKDGWHGKPLTKEQLTETLKELGEVDINVRGKICLPKTQISNVKTQNQNSKLKTNYKLYDQVATREGYGEALVELAKQDENILVLDADVRPSTYAHKFQKAFPDRFFEMHIAEQNMLGMALGLSKIGYTVFSSTFASFLTRAFDQIRMSQYSNPNIKICGSHAGVSIGEDGPSQMGLEDLAMMRSILNSTVLYPSDAVSAQKLVEIMSNNDGLFYLRTNRGKTPVIYDEKEKFEVGGSKLFFFINDKLQITNVKSITNNKSNIKTLIIGAGVTLHEALKAQQELAKENIETVVMDCYSVKPIDVQSIGLLAKKIKNIVVVEDHYPAGGLGEAVLSSIQNSELRIKNFVHLCVRKIPRSGKPEELARYEEIDAEAIIKAVKSF